MPKAGYGDTFYRQETCGRCKHGQMVTSKRCKCLLNKRTGSADRACWYEAFQPRFPPGYVGTDDEGTPLRSQTCEDYRTPTQWASVGRLPQPGAVGLDMKAVYLARQAQRYYHATEVAPYEEQGMSADAWSWYRLLSAAQKQEYLAQTRDGRQ